MGNKPSLADIDPDCGAAWGTVPYDMSLISSTQTHTHTQIGGLSRPYLEEVARRSDAVVV